MIIFVTGGARSGKSSYAMQLAKSLSANPLYLATARRWDTDFEARVQRHVADRDSSWTTIEEEKNISGYDFTGKTVVIDCVTLWLTNFFADNGQDIELSLQQAGQEIEQLAGQEACFIIVSNEIGMGLHAPTEAGRKFSDLQGWVNQLIARKAAKAILMVSGLPVVIKQDNEERTDSILLERR